MPENISRAARDLTAGVVSGNPVRMNPVAPVRLKLVYCLLEKPGFNSCHNPAIIGPGELICEYCWGLDPQKLKAILGNEEHDYPNKVREARVDKQKWAWEEMGHRYLCAFEDPKLEGLWWRHLAFPRSTYVDGTCNLQRERYKFCTPCTNAFKNEHWYRDLVSKNTRTVGLCFWKNMEDFPVQCVKKSVVMKRKNEIDGNVRYECKPVTNKYMQCSTCRDRYKSDKDIMALFVRNEDYEEHGQWLRTRDPNMFP